MGTGFKPDWANYHVDEKMGSDCKINGRDAFIDFQADLASFKVNGTDIIAEYYRSHGNTSATVVDYKNGFLDIVANFIVYGDGGGDVQFAPDNNIAIRNYNKLLEECKQCTIKIEDYEFEFYCIMHKVKIEYTGIEGYYSLEINFNGVRRIKNIQAFSVNQNTTSTYLTVRNEGLVKSGVIIEVKPNYTSPSSGMSGTLTIGDILIKCPGNDALAPNEKIIIDGINGSVTKVLADGTSYNYFNNVDMFELPTVNPGTVLNLIDIKKSGIGALIITLTYYQIFDY